MTNMEHVDTYVKIVRKMFPTSVTACAVGVLRDQRPETRVMRLLSTHQNSHSRIRPEVDRVPGNGGTDRLWCLRQELQGRRVDDLVWCDLRKVALCTRRRVRGRARGQQLGRDRQLIVPDCDLLPCLWYR